MSELYMYDVDYKDKAGEQWRVEVMAHSEERAKELVAKETECKEVVNAERKYSWA